MTELERLQQENAALKAANEMVSKTANAVVEDTKKTLTPLLKSMAEMCDDSSGPYQGVSYEVLEDLDKAWNELPDELKKIGRDALTKEREEGDAGLPGNDH